MTTRIQNVALVVPPFAPLGIPCLGVAALAGGLKARGIPCRTFYWSFRILRDLPATTVKRRAYMYSSLSGSSMWPFNEWVFAGPLYPNGELSDRELETRKALRARMRGTPTQLPAGADSLLHLRALAPKWITEMADELEPYDLIGVNTTFFQNIPALALLKEIKRRWPQKVTVLGGANCDDTMGGGLLEHFSQLDYVFGGEVDHSFPEFCARLARGESVTDLPGLFYRDSSGVVRGGPAPPVEDMDALPIPDYDDLVAERERFGLHELGDLMLAL